MLHNLKIGDYIVLQDGTHHLVQCVKRLNLTQFTIDTATKRVGLNGTATRTEWNHYLDGKWIRDETKLDIPSPGDIVEIIRHDALETPGRAVSGKVYLLQMIDVTRPTDTIGVYSSREKAFSALTACERLLKTTGAEVEFSVIEMEVDK